MGLGFELEQGEEARLERILGDEHADRLQQVRPLRAHRVDQPVDAARERVVHRVEAKPRAIDALHRAHLQHGVEPLLREAAAEPQVERDRVVEKEGA